MNGEVHKFIGIRDPKKLPRERIGVYKCSLNTFGIPSKGYVLAREYDLGGFSEELLKNKWMPDLASKCSTKGWVYPLLITSYLLEEGVEFTFKKPPNRKATWKDATKPRRKRETPEKREAVVLSPTEYKLL